jgi:hypothetical protein
MAQVLTERVNLNVGLESTLSTLPSSGWLQLQPNSFGDYGPTYKKLSRMPISQNRMYQQSILVDEDSKFSFDADLTKDVLDEFASGIFMSTVQQSGGTGTAYFRPTAVASNAWTVASGGALASGIMVYYSGASVAGAANNGLHVLTTGSTGTSIVTGDTLVNETCPANATLEVAGVRATSGDVQMNSSGNLTSTTLNFTSLGLNVGQWIWVGGDTALGGGNSFATLAYRGFARIVSITSNLLTLQRRSWTVGSADTGTGKTIELFFSRWVCNVASNNASYLMPSWSFEVTYTDLNAVGTPEYEYMLGNMLDECTFNFSLTTKATLNLGFKGTVSNDPTVTRQTGASSALAPLKQAAVSTATDLMRLRLTTTAEAAVSTDFQSIKITCKNNVTPEKELGILGASKLNVGYFECDWEAEVIFTSDQIIIGVHNNEQVAVDVAARNGDFGMLFDISAANLTADGRKLEMNKSVIISSKAAGFQDPVTGFVAGLSIFPYLPSS